MNDQCLIAEFRDATSFRTALEVLEKSDYPVDQISIITSADQVEASPASDAIETSPGSPPAEKTTAAATLVGGSIGAVLGTATLMGPILVAGPIVGMAGGAVGGGLLSAIESWGVKKDAGQKYEDRVRDGAKLVILTGSGVQLDKGHRMLKTCNADSIQRFDA